METIEYSKELYQDIMENNLQYLGIGHTVCGAEDPAIIYLGEEFKKKYPQFAKYKVVRVIDKYINSWRADTLLEFSNKTMTPKEQDLWYNFKKWEETQED